MNACNLASILSFSNISGLDLSVNTDESICSNLVDLVVFDERFVKEAKKRFLYCSKKFDYSIPENAHKVNNQRIDGAFIENGWVCNRDFFKKGKKCQKIMKWNLWQV